MSIHMLGTELTSAAPVTEIPNPAADPAEGTPQLTETPDQVATIASVSPDNQVTTGDQNASENITALLSAENLKTKEQIRDYEVATIVDGLNLQSAAEMKTNADVMASDSSRSVHAYADIARKITVGTFTSDPPTVIGNVDGKDPSKGEPLFFKNTGSGWEACSKGDKDAVMLQTVTGGIKKDDGTVTVHCTINGKTEDLPAASLLDAQLLAESDNITNFYAKGTADRAVVEARIAKLKGDKGVAANNLTPDQIAETAKHAGKMETQAMRDHINLKRAVAKPGETLTVEQKANNDKLDAMLARLDGKTVLTAEDFQFCLKNLYGGDVEGMRLDLARQAQQLEVTASQRPDPEIKEAYQKHIGLIKTHLHLVTVLSKELTSENGGFGQLFNKIDRGMVKKEAVAGLNAALATGNPTELVQTLITSAEKEGFVVIGDQKIHKNQLLDIAKGAAKWGGIGGLVLALALLMSATKSN